MTATKHAGMSGRDAIERNGYLTTVGRATGRDHEIEIWFAVEPGSAGRTVYLLSGGRDRADWVRNVSRNPSVHFRVNGVTHHGSARIVHPDEPIDVRSREVVAEKYGERSKTGELSIWARTSLPVVIELAETTGSAG